MVKIVRKLGLLAGAPMLLICSPVAAQVDCQAANQNVLYWEAMVQGAQQDLEAFDYWGKKDSAEQAFQAKLFGGACIGQCYLDAKEEYDAQITEIESEYAEKQQYLLSAQNSYDNAVTAASGC